MNLITSRRKRSKAALHRVASHRVASQRRKRRRKCKMRSRKRKRKRVREAGAIITAVEFRVPVSRDVVTLVAPKKSRWGPVGLEMKFGTSDAGCYLYTDAETGSANGEIRAPARKSTLYRGPRCRNFRLIARIAKRKVDNNSRMFYQTSVFRMRPRESDFKRIINISKHNLII